MADYDAVMIGTGFGGSIAAEQLTERWSGELPNRKIVVLFVQVANESDAKFCTS